MDTAMLERLRVMLSKHRCVSKHEILASTRLAEDLGMAGDDGREFIESYADAFGVDIARFQSEAHFGPEAGSPLVGVVLGSVVVAGSIAWWTIPISVAGLVAGYRWMIRRDMEDGPYTLTVSDLIEYAEAGEWAFDYDKSALGRLRSAR